MGDRISLLELRTEPPHAICAEVAFAGDGVAITGVSLREGRTTKPARLFRAEPDDTNGAKRPSRIHDVPGSRSDDGHAGSVIDCAGAKVPAVEMAADEKNRRLRVASRQVRNN